jgi:hypothetical protein
VKKRFSESREYGTVISAVRRIAAIVLPQQQLHPFHRSLTVYQLMTPYATLRGATVAANGNPRIRHVVTIIIRNQKAQVRVNYNGRQAL